MSLAQSRPYYKTAPRPDESRSSGHLLQGRFPMQVTRELGEMFVGKSDFQCHFRMVRRFSHLVKGKIKSKI